MIIIQDMMSDDAVRDGPMPRSTRRYGEPQDFANLVYFLASLLAGYIARSVIPVDGEPRCCHC